MDVTFIVFLFLVSVSNFKVQAQNPNRSISSLLTFGDSTVDSGNNNFIKTLIKANFDPYGIDLQSDVPKGRFCNGKLTTDFLASFLGIKEFIPPYLNKSLSVEELMTGVSFASAGTGYDPLTAELVNVIPMQKELDLFKEYKEQLEGVMGTGRMKNHIENALFIVSCGSIDFVENYFLVPIRSKQFNINEYQNFLVEKARSFLQGLIELGARKIVVLGALPIGCLPLVITLKSNVANELSRQCIEGQTDVARQFDQKLQAEVQSMQNNPASLGSAMVYIDILEPLLEIIQNYKDAGFVYNRGCCGSGLIEFSFLCNSLTPVCPNRNEIVFWDSIHPTQRVYNMLSLKIRDIITAVF